MIGSAEDVHESVEKAAQIKEEHQWDYVVCLTDLPSISDNKVVVSDFNSDKHVAMLSLPSLGFIDLKRKLVKTMTSLIEQLYYNQPKDKNAPHPFVRVKAVEPDEDATSKQRYINILFIISWIQLIGGLTRANQPWKNIFNFKKIISVAFATGTYVSIFSMPWELSVIYSPLRLIILMVIAILGMAGWLFYAHQLIEKKTAKSQRVYRYIYNSTTLVTLSLITLINYVILYLLLIISITLFVPVELFNSWTSAQAQFTFSNYMRLIWFVSSLGLLAGAMGSTVENEEKIRRITYSYRQYHRYKEAEQESRNYDNNKQIENSVKKQFPLSKIDKETIYMKETDSYHLRYLSSSRSRGMFRLVSGMTFANNPLNMMASLSNTVAIAFTTGAFGLVFTTMWQMAYNFSMWRLFGISIIAIIGMLIWIMMSHDLWEPVNKSNHKHITWLYNLTTIMTLIFAIIIYYIILYLLFLIAEIVLLPSGFLGQQVGLKGPAGIDLYLSIPWFAASISTVAGAIGAGLLNDELIKESTYGYRQRVRYEEQRR